jgi:tetratricopeptide (TPR) repeat protein
MNTRSIHKLAAITIRRVSGVLVLALLGVLPLHAQDNLFDASHSYNFGKYLYEQERWQDATVELQRAVFLQASDSAYYFLLNAYHFSRQWEQGLATAQKAYPPGEMPPIVLEAFIPICWRKGNWTLADSYKVHPSVSRRSLNDWALSEALLQSRWQAADSILEDKEQLPPKSYITHQILINQALDYTPKRAGIALALAVIPGAGKIYAGRGRDAFMTISIVGLSAFQAWRGFRREGINSWPGWVFGSIGAGFYLGNFYGSWKAAKNANRDFELKLRKDAESLVFGD